LDLYYCYEDNNKKCALLREYCGKYGFVTKLSLLSVFSQRVPAGIGCPGYGGASQ
jgi:hypothetical protein